MTCSVLLALICERTCVNTESLCGNSVPHRMALRSVTGNFVSIRLRFGKREKNDVSGIRLKQLAQHEYKCHLICSRLNGK